MDLNKQNNIKEIDGDNVALSRAELSDAAVTPPALVDGSKVTWGEKLFNQGVYGFAMFGINLLFSAGITYWFKHNNSGIRYYDSIANWYRNTLFKGKDNYLVKVGTNALTLLWGGAYPCAHNTKTSRR